MTTRSLMNRSSAPIAVLLAAGLVMIFLAGQAQANPRYGGQCQYCHDGGPEGTLEITGTDLELDGLKLFTAAPGDSVDFGFSVAGGDPPYYYLALRALDTLNADPAPGEPLPGYGQPRLYTPDAGWSTSAPTGEQYVQWFGQYYVTPATFGPGDFLFSLILSDDVAPGDYELMATVGGGFPSAAPGFHPEGGWAAHEDFILRVVPEPSSLLLIALGLPAIGLITRRRRSLPSRGTQNEKQNIMKRTLPVSLGLVLGACLLTITMGDVAQAYPSRTTDCAVCHGLSSPPDGDAALDIQESDGTSTDLFEAVAGGSTEFVFEITDLPLVDPAPTDPEDPIHRRFYLSLDKLDFLNVGADGSAADIPYSPFLYTAPDADDGTWHNHRNDHLYINSNGSYYTISDSQLTSIPFNLTLDPSVAPGDYQLEVKLVGGRPHDGEGWTVLEQFTLRVLSADFVTVPEPTSLALLIPGAIVAGLCARRRRKRML